ncbi:MAG: Xaa-Pro peptidase family protein [Bacteroidetes bacterium]|nr:Xaa-Pro peptidase family protein [Bacteroidota bacterium]MBU1371344.1 Xaa-Pro peptidase family protein [Bacteroidota bacterium]MBU1485831.1 Xaa-Pro peptidase family protein [Bacteroidota bacterium]MBU1761089.1 Xaa-Pro peptidase family protein [Bacteroidota bacterium]MBU2046802.1 Xaa-Pro peptidase family protein [Bacteroidota bacterium]
MTIKRRDLIKITGLAVAAGSITGLSSFSTEVANTASGLKPMTDDVVPISLSERKARIEKAQRLLIENKMGALILEPSTGLNYFTGIRWGQSERTMVAIIPAKGEIKYICPAFEEARFREQIRFGTAIYVWQEDESPYQLIVKALKDSNVSTGNIGIEERTRFFIADGIKKAAPKLNVVSGDPITIPCRMMKSATEIALMQKANDITLAAIKYSVGQLKEGMSQGDLSSMIMKAQGELGGSPDFALCLFGQSSAFPHGSKQPQKLKKGDIVLMDCGCTVQGYNSDITKTIVFGAEPTKRQQEIWELEKKAQAAGFAAAKIGAPCENVDAAARKVITDAGFGPGYQIPGLPHRTGHGIGMDGHEWGNMVKGNKKLLEAGMCFSIEPTIAIMGEFGVRFEDCVYMTEAGPKWFSQPSKSIYEPFESE